MDFKEYINYEEFETKKLNLKKLFHTKITKNG